MARSVRRILTVAPRRGRGQPESVDDQIWRGRWSPGPTRWSLRSKRACQSGSPVATQTPKATVFQSQPFSRVSQKDEESGIWNHGLIQITGRIRWLGLCPRISLAVAFSPACCIQTRLQNSNPDLLPLSPSRQPVFQDGRFVGRPSRHEPARSGPSPIWSQDRFCPTFKLLATPNPETIHDLGSREANRQRREACTGKQRISFVFYPHGKPDGRACACDHTAVDHDRHKLTISCFHLECNPQLPQSPHELRCPPPQLSPYHL